MAKKSASSSAVAPASPAPPAVGGTIPVTPPPPSAAAPEADPTPKINAYNLPALKTAFDQALISSLTAPQGGFVQDFTHTDVKLLLGFLACGVALGSTGWVYWQKIEWEDSKGIMKIAVGLYTFLMTISTLYSYRVEKGTIFVGKKKSLVDGRIETCHLTIASRTQLAATTKAPLYHPKITLLRSTNAGKSLLSKKAFEETVDMATFATEDGIVGDGLEEWLSGVLKK